MSIKSTNEITVKVICSFDEINNNLREKGFKVIKIFTLNDYYFIPKNLEINNLTTREILNNAVIIRDKTDNNGERLQRITYKKKQIDNNGEILSQIAYNCDVCDYKSAIELFNKLEYFELMNIKENATIYCKNDIEFSVKYIEDDYILIEIETNKHFNTTQKLIELVNYFDLPIEKNNYFVKKAEDKLNKILKRN